MVIHWRHADDQSSGKHLSCDSACLVNCSSCYWLHHTWGFLFSTGSRTHLTMFLHPALSGFIVPLFLASHIPGTLVSAQCKLFSLACQGLGANHKSQMVSGYFVRVTVAKHQCTESFESHTNIGFHYSYFSQTAFHFCCIQMWTLCLLLETNATPQTFGRASRGIPAKIN